MIFLGKTAGRNKYYRLSLKSTDTKLFERYMVHYVPPSRFWDIFNYMSNFSIQKDWKYWKFPIFPTFWHIFPTKCPKWWYFRRIVMSIRQNNGKNIGLGHFLEAKTKMIAALPDFSKICAHKRFCCFRGTSKGQKKWDFFLKIS